jgi:hypothetical protein
MMSVRSTAGNGTTGWTTGAGSAIGGASDGEGVSIIHGVAGFGVSNFGVIAEDAPFVGALQAQYAEAAPGDEVVGSETCPGGTH